MYNAKAYAAAECDIAACPRHDQAARANRTRRSDRHPVLRYLPLRSAHGP